MTRAARYAYAFLAWAWIVALLVQVFLIGLGLFADRSFLETHGSFGWSVVHLSPILVLIAAALSRAGRRHWQWALALAAVVFVVPIFATLRDSVPVMAALHPVAAVIASWLGLRVARNSLEALRQPDAPAADPSAEAATA